MGSWGYEPKNSDNAADGFAAITDATRKPLLKLMRRRLGKKRSQERYDRVGVVQRLLESGLGVPLEACELAWKDLALLQDDADWIGQWKQPRRLQTASTQMLRAFAQIVDGEHERQRRARQSRRGTKATRLRLRRRPWVVILGTPTLADVIVQVPRASRRPRRW